MIAHGSNHRDAVWGAVWDTVRGEQLGALTPHAFDTVKAAVSPSGECAVTMAHDLAVHVHDLTTGALRYSLNSPRQKEVHRNFTMVNSCRWSPDGSRVYLTDLSAIEAVRDGGGPVGLTGAFDAKTGRRLFWFKHADGTPVEIAAGLELCAARKLVLLNPDIKGVTANTNSREIAGLWNADDGTFIREIRGLGWGARFSPDGKRLVSGRAIVDVDSGAVLRTFTSSHATDTWRVTYSEISPTCTLRAAINEQRRLLIQDVRSGLEVCQIDLNEKLPAHAVLEQILWHPAETQVALKVSNSAHVLQVNLLPPAAAFSGDKKELQEFIRRLGADDPLERNKAFSGLSGAGESAVLALDAVLYSERTPPAKLQAIAILEALARQQQKNAAQMLEKLAALPEENESGAWARDALLRLQAAAGVKALREKHKNAKPLKWAAKPPRPGGDF